MRLLPEKEKELLQDVKLQLTKRRENEPAENLFVLVNFMDLLDDDEDRLAIKQRIESFIYSKNQLVKGENRIHYISAKAALKSILNGVENEYLKYFQDFTNYLEQFLICERGRIKITQTVTQVHDIVNSSLAGLEQATKILDSNIKISETERQQILEKIGEASGRDVKIRLLGKQTVEEATQEAEQAWEKWQEKLKNRLIQKSKNWTSLHSPVFNQKDLIKDYINCFSRDLVNEIDDWGNTELGNSILKRNITLLTTNIELELEAVKAPFQNIKQQVKTNLYDQINFSIYGISDDFGGAGGFLGGIGVGGALAAGLLAFTGLGLVAIVVASIATAIAGSFGLGMLDFDGLRDQIKIKVLELGFQKLEISTDKVFENLYQIVEAAVAYKVQAASQVIEQAISLYENLLEQQDKVHQETLEQRNVEKVWIEHKRKELEQVQGKMEKEYY